MLLVETCVARSTIPAAGLGLFAKVDIPAGTVLWRFDQMVDHLVPVAEALARAKADPTFRALVPRCAYIGHSDHRHYIWHGDDGRFFNHADDPNCAVLADESTVALRDIAAGEELFCDYNAFAVADPIHEWQPGDGGK